jgi:hypothetical protein
MRKPYIEIFSDIQSESQNNFKELGLKIAEFLDKIIVWLIGLSTGAILILISKAKELLYIETCTLNNTLTMLVGSIVAGLLGRILYAIALYLGYSIISSYSAQVRMLGFPHKQRELTGDETKENIYLLFQEDFNIDIPFILENKDNLEGDKLLLLDEKARKLYSYYSDVILSSIQGGKENLEKIAISTFGFKKDYFKKRVKKSNRTKGIVWRLFTYLSFGLYILSAVLFGSSICYLITQYVRFAK